MNISNLTTEVLDQYKDDPAKAAEHLSDSEFSELQSLLKHANDFNKGRSEILQKAMYSKYGEQANQIREAKNSKGQVSWNSLENPMLSISSTSPITTKWDSKSFWAVVLNKVNGADPNGNDLKSVLVADLLKLGVDIKINVSDSNWLKIKAGDTELHQAAKKLLEPFRTVEPKKPTFAIKLKKEKEEQ